MSDGLSDGWVSRRWTTTAPWPCRRSDGASPMDHGRGQHHCPARRRGEAAERQTAVDHHASASSAPCWCWPWPVCSPRAGISSDKAAPGVTLGRISVVGQDRDRLTDAVTRAVADSSLDRCRPGRTGNQGLAGGTRRERGRGRDRGRAAQRQNRRGRDRRARAAVRLRPAQPVLQGRDRPERRVSTNTRRTRS